MRRINQTLILHSAQKSTQNILKVGSDTIKFLEKKIIGESFITLVLAMLSWIYDAKRTSSKNKKQVGLYPNKNLLQNKRKIQESKKIAYRIEYSQSLYMIRG